MTTAIERDAKGIPLKSGYPDSVPVAVLYSSMNLVFGLLGLALAWFFAFSSEDKKEQVDRKITILITYDLGWLYAGIFLLKLFQLPQGIMLGEARKASKVGVPDQHVYKVMGTEGSKLGYVLMENDGVHGTFNRAQRACMNYHEGFPTVALQYVAAGFVFPLESFIAIVVYAISKIVSVRGYINSQDKRMSGALPGTMAQTTIQGMILIAAYKSLFP